ncbi:PREDICTED: intraflagellar transport protein 140 homolog [Branchiostoma belcheri]|uniref:Intraflagellar transport protein 140 homolog n=1 Tax=Branchiostoma belcheri TaxID=7741 RepID=A0A6P4Y8C9_BRABE|nr:PREDICTED: intraflagellar transport protein 140 homolog [Branchiostoma belcheri]
MALYFDSKIQGPDGMGPCSNLAWHRTHTVLAVAASTSVGGGSVNLFMDDGEPVPDGCIQRSSQVTCMSWHPNYRVLAMGWENGDVLMWNDQDKELHEAKSIHDAGVAILEWSTNGTRLLSGDKNGLITVWKMDGKGRAQASPFCKHQMEQSVSVCLVRPGTAVDPENDISGLARAAVSGDEKALDMFSWKKSLGSKITMGPSEGLAFFLGGIDGDVYYLDDKGKSLKAFTADGPIEKLLFYEEKNILVTVTSGLVLTQHNVSSEGSFQEVTKVKLSGRTGQLDIIWAGRGLMATATGEPLIRMWDLEKDDNYALPLPLDNTVSFTSGEAINCLSFCSKKGVLAGGTSEGKVVMWRYAPAPGLAGKKQDGDTKWKFLSPTVLEGNITQIKWGSSLNLLAVNIMATVIILSEQSMNAHFRDGVTAVQVSSTQLSIDNFNTKAHYDLKTEIQVKGVYVTQNNLAVWNGKKLVVYDVPSDKGGVIRMTGTFQTDSALVCMHEQNLYTIEPGKIQVRNFQGTVKQLLTFSETEGEPIAMDVCGHFLVAGTSTNFLRMWDLSRREAKQHCNPKNLGEVIPELGMIVSVKSNCSGSKVAVLVKKSQGQMDSRLWLYDVELDSVQYFDFSSGMGELDELTSAQEATGEEVSEEQRGRTEAAKDVAGRFPRVQYWDPLEPKLLTCEAILPPPSEDKKGSKMSSLSVAEVQPDVMVVSLFSTPEHGILLQDAYATDTAHDTLIGLQVPYFYFTKKAGESAKAQDAQASTMSLVPENVAQRTMRDFIGLEESDKNSRDAMMNFSYFLTIGNMDEAFKAIKLIKSESVWENMAKMCVKSRRLDVARVCLGNMGHARGARALREADKEPELDAKVAVLAIQLGLNEDAERLLKHCQRYDLLNELYQSTNQWSKALETAEAHDRIHLRTTYYHFAKHLESQGDVLGAVPNYEKSDTHRFEVPRMLFDDPQSLEAYIMKTKDKALRKWWAQYMESTGEMEAGLQFYEAAGDYLSLVRVYCYCGNMDKAAEIANETGDRAACYHLGRQSETQDRIKDAIHFFTRAGAYGSAIKLCKEHGYEDQLMNLALLSTPQDMLEAARYYEKRSGMEDKAVMLYHKGGHFSKALELAFRTQQFAALQLIAEDLDEKTDPVLLNKCADFFMEHGQFDKAVELLVVARKYVDALELCMQHNVTITEPLAEKMTIPKDSTEFDAEYRTQLLERLADCCMKQGSYHLATKKYTQAGNKIKAMRALLKSGDTEKIIFFAGVSRQKEIYVMAANYLQSLDWRKDPEIMKSIIGFYTKGRALDSLAGFYDACAQVEIDEYQNYEKALGALSEAYKCMTKARMKNASEQEEKVANIKHRVALIKKFLQARKVYEDDPEETMKQCQVLLEESDLDSAVRIGDVYGLMIEHYARQENYPKAYQLMEEMRQRIPTVNMAYYVNMRTIEAVHRALDIPLGRGMGAEKNMRAESMEEDEGEEVEEDVAEDYDDQV